MLYGQPVVVTTLALGGVRDRHSPIMYWHAIFLEVSDAVMDDSRSVVWQEAGDRMHSPKALIEFLLLGRGEARCQVL